MELWQLQVKQRQYKQANNAYMACLQNPAILPENRLYLRMAADRAKENYETAWKEYQAQAMQNGR